MIESLYKPFQKWSEKGAVWIFSDPHFEDEDLVNVYDDRYFFPVKTIVQLTKPVLQFLQFFLVHGFDIRFIHMVSILYFYFMRRFPVLLHGGLPENLCSF